MKKLSLVIFVVVTGCGSAHKAPVVSAGGSAGDSASQSSDASVVILGGSKHADSGVLVVGDESDSGVRRGH